MGILPTKNNQEGNWKTQTYLLGVIGGTLFGLVAAFFYNRAAEDDTTKNHLARPNRVQTGDLLGLGLAMLAIFRQVAELGRTPEDKKQRRR
ncbi:MAG: hypothetical protein SF162_05665 [bacterium]|nr:hypothetical protein [bacterium]